MTAIRMCDVGKAFKQQSVIAGVNLDIADGEFVVFVGPSGCGKSTLLRLIAGLEDITSGDLFIGGRRVNDLPPAQRGVAMVFQSYALYPHMTVFDNMAFGLKLAKQDKQEMKNRVLWAAETLRIDHLLDRLPKDLSGGQRQRVAIGRAIVRQPQVFLFDEPLSNLDAALRVQTRLEIAKLHRDFNASMIYVTHDQVEAMTLADRIVLLNAGEAILKEGSVAQVGSPLDLYHRPCNRFVASFIGSPAMNFLPAGLVNVDSNISTVIVAQEAIKVAVDTAGAQPGAAVSLGIRPENLVLGVEQPNAMQGEVLHVEHLGEASYIHFRIADIETPVIARHAGDLPVKLGDLLPISLPAQHCHLFNDHDRAFPRSENCAEDRQ